MHHFLTDKPLLFDGTFCSNIEIHRLGIFRQFLFPTGIRQYMPAQYNSHQMYQTQSTYIQVQFYGDLLVTRGQKMEPVPATFT